MHQFPIRVYYEDTDFSGVVYHASYLRFMERGRTEWLREKGVFHVALHAQGQGEAFVVRRMEIDFRKPAHIDDMLRIETEIVEMKGASAILGQAIYRDAQILVSARVTIAFVKNGKPVRLPEALRNKPET
jgi:acyl-CoA thioester hydrolase